MTEWNLGSGVVWLVVGVLGLGTFGLRLSFIQLHAWLDEFPPQVERALGFIPPAILAVLVFPEVFVLNRSVASVLIDARVLAGGVAAVTAWRTGSMLATIGVGMGALWGIQLVFG